MTKLLRVIVMIILTLQMHEYLIAADRNFQQVENRKVSGIIKTIDEQPLEGALIVGQGATAFSDVVGYFEIQVPTDAQQLQISLVGYKTTNVSISGQSQLSITLEEDDFNLEEVVVTGYGVEEKKNVTAAIATVDADEIKTVPQSDVTDMLDGRMAGVQVLSDNSPGGGNSIRVRGFGTVNNNDPLIIVDGTPITNGLNTVNPNDIETIQVLKDAASASIYGARASNGVVIITTKNGSKTSKTQFQYNGYMGMQHAFNLPKMLSAQGYGDFLWLASENDGISPSNDIYGNDPNNPVIPQYLDSDQTIPSANTDWMKEIFRVAPIQSHTFSLANGGEQGSQYFSFNFFDQDGVLDHTGFRRLQTRLNSSFNIGDYFTIGENFNASLTNRVSTQTNSALGSVVYDAMQYPSIVPVRDINGNFAGNPLNDIQNPAGKLYRNKDNKQKRVRLLGNAYGQFDYKEFTFRSQVGIDYQNYNLRNFSPVYDDILSQNAVNELRTANSNIYELTFTNTLQYQNSFGLNNLNVLVGQEAITHQDQGFSATRRNFLYEDPNFWYLNFGSSDQLNSGDASEWKLASYFGKVNYNFDERYLLTATVRRDGTSRLSENRYDVFPAFSGGWRIDRESFFDSKLFTGLLLRSGWGITGNQQLPSYSTVFSYTNNATNSNYAIDGGQNSVSTGLVQTRVPNPGLRWERSHQFSLGLDANMIDDRLSFAFDYYNNITKDILVYAPIAQTYGGSNDAEWRNAGEMTNKGFDFNANFRGQAKQLTYDLGMNLSTYKNELTELNSGAYLGVPGSILHVTNFDQEVSRTAVGQPIGAFFGHVSQGVFKSEAEINEHGAQPNARPGDLKYKDINNDGVINNDDRTFIGSPHPDLTLGFTTNFNYKGFDLGLFFNGSFGNEIYNLTKYKTGFADLSAYNKEDGILNAWSLDNPNSNIPILSLDDPNNNIRPSSYYVEKGNYFKLNQVDLGYTFENLDTKGIGLRIYAQANNLFTITKYSGLTPQIGTQNYSADNQNLDIGVDRGLYPPNRSYTFGANFKF